MTIQKNIYEMTDRELRAYKRRVRRQREVRRRLLTGLMTFCLIVICATSYHAIHTSASTGTDDLNFKYYTSITVAHGETLWDIAEEYIDYTEYKNKNAYIAEVQSINHLDNNNTILTGQRLIVPYYSNTFIK